MDRDALQRTEQRVWDTITDTAPLCEAVSLANPWSKSGVANEIPIGRNGQGLLSWIPDTRLKQLRSVASGPVTGDRLQLMLIQSATQTVPVNVRLLIRSSWTRLGVPMSEAFTYPEGIILWSGESDRVLHDEADFYCLWMDCQRLLAFRAEDYARADVETLATWLSDPAFQERYFTLGGVKERCPRHTRTYPARKPSQRFLLIHREHDPLLVMYRPINRLFKQHRVFEVLNVDNPIITSLKKEPPWETYTTSQSTEPDDCPPRQDPQSL